MQPSKALADQLYRDEVEFAKRTPPELKLMAGADLFDYACGITRAGIRHQHPGASDDEVHRMLLDRLALGERLENRP